MNLPAVSVEFLSALTVLDEAIARSVQRAGCPRCGGPLYQANYHRKPRGLSLDEGHSTITLRHSLCCGRDGCRRRTLPPSLRFFGRRVYLLAVVVFAAALAHATASVRAAGERFSVPSQTVGRWVEWWGKVAPVTACGGGSCADGSRARSTPMSYRSLSSSTSVPMLATIPQQRVR